MCSGTALLLEAGTGGHGATELIMTAIASSSRARRNEPRGCSDALARGESRSDSYDRRRALGRRGASTTSAHSAELKADLGAFLDALPIENGVERLRSDLAGHVIAIGEVREDSCVDGIDGELASVHTDGLASATDLRSPLLTFPSAHLDATFGL